MADKLAKVAAQAPLNDSWPYLGVPKATVTKKHSEVDGLQFQPCLGQSTWQKTSEGPYKTSLAEEIR